jgi:tetratricopeptide (TPR) repeat protein
MPRRSTHVLHVPCATLIAVVALFHLPDTAPALAQAPKTLEHRATPPKTKEDLIARLEAMRAKVYDRNAQFSRSQALAELRILATDAEARGTLPDALRDILLMIGLVESKSGDPREVISALRRALAVPGTTPLPADRLARTHHMLAEHLKDARDHAAAAAHYREAAAHMMGQPAFTEDQRLGTLQDLGYVLHEAKRYQDALDNNLNVLAGGEHIHGADSPLLRSVITNIAQNLHALDRKPEAEPYLVRALALARAEGKVWNEQDLLFQLGVLAFETGRNGDARRHMTERIDVIKRNNRKDLLGDATEDLRALEDKIKTGRQ